MEQATLNKKLLEWLGFKRYAPTGGFLTPQLIPDLIESDQLNFTESLDACFKWLVPKATQDMFLSELFDLWLDELEDEKELALALCKAIEKLI